MLLLLLLLLGHNGTHRYYENTPFYDLIRWFQYSVRVTTTIRLYHTGNRKNVLPPRMFFFPAIKTRNSTLKFVFLLFFCFPFGPPAHSVLHTPYTRVRYIHVHKHTHAAGIVVLFLHAPATEI